MNLIPLLRLLQMVAFFKKQDYNSRKTLGDIIFTYSGIRKYYNYEIIFNTKTHFYAYEKLFASF